MPSLFVIILNWNGWKDTLECLDSLRKSDHPNYRLIIVDNGSTDGSCERFREWSSRHQVEVVKYDKDQALAGGLKKREESMAAIVPSGRIAIIEAGENLGFAGGSNVGIQYALARGAEHIMLLNNDTVLAPNALSVLAGFLERNPDYQGVTGQTRYFNRPEIIWNCGGDLTWFGTRRYHNAGAPVLQIPNEGFRPITFMTGCAPLFRADVFRLAGLLTTRFFFGEEDFEFSRRLRSLGQRMACCYDAIIYHKVGMSVDRAAAGKRLGTIYIHYLNRFVNLRLHWPFLLWHIWRMIYMPYVIFLAWKGLRPPVPVLTRFLLSLIRESSRRQNVDRAAFEWILSHGYLSKLSKVEVRR